MTNEQAEAIVNALEDLCDIEAAVYSNYSGRGMCGKTCAGIVVSSAHDAMMIGYAACLAGLSADDLPSRSDSMGRDLIYY